MTEEIKQEIVEEKPEEDLIKKATEAAERIEKANIEQAKLLKKQEEILALQRLQGRAVISTQEKPKIETAEEYAERFRKGEFNPLK